MSTLARGAIAYLPIDGLIASLEDALAEIAEIRSRMPAEKFGVLTGQVTFAATRIEIDQCECAAQEALNAARAYARAPE